MSDLIKLFVTLMEVEARIMPLHLRREELAVRELVKIMVKYKNEEIAKCFDTWKYQMEESTEKFLSPINKAVMQLTDLISNTGLEVRSVDQKLHTFNAWHLLFNVQNTGIILAHLNQKQITRGRSKENH